MGRHSTEFDHVNTARPWYQGPAPIACTALLAAGALVLGASLAGGSPASPDGATSSSSASDTSTAAYDVSPYFRYGASSGAGSGSHGSSGGAAMSVATTADASESTGIVLIDTTLDYQGQAAAGTGMVLSSDGVVLTNNHVVEGSTGIRVTVASTGRSYDAKVVGTDAKDDVAVLQLSGASGLTTVPIDTDDTDSVGDTVTAVGNASGGGVLMAAVGSVSRVNASVTTQAEGAVAAETLSGMIEIVGDVVAGDSGGALLDHQGEVIGMTTAASSGQTPTTAYAIPIDSALAIAKQIEDGDESGNVTIGYPAFLGVALSSGGSATGLGGRSGSSLRGSSGAVVGGALLAGVYPNTPAARAGLAAGDTITTVDGAPVTGSTLSGILAAHGPGDRVTLTWVDSAGGSHTATVTLIEGPAA